MPPTRRFVLRTFGGGLSVALTGCLRSPEFHPEDHLKDWHDQPVRGQGASIDVERTVESSRLEDKCGWEAEDAVREVVMNRADRPSEVHINYTMTTALPNAGWVVLVQRVITLGPRGKVRETPEISFNALLKATPSTVSMTVRSENKKSSCRYAVYTYDTYNQLD